MYKVPRHHQDLGKKSSNNLEIYQKISSPINHETIQSLSVAETFIILCSNFIKVEMYFQKFGKLKKENRVDLMGAFCNKFIFYCDKLDDIVKLNFGRMKNKSQIRIENGITKMGYEMISFSLRKSLCSLVKNGILPVVILLRL